MEALKAESLIATQFEQPEECYCQSDAGDERIRALFRQVIDGAILGVVSGGILALLGVEVAVAIGTCAIIGAIVLPILCCIQECVDGQAHTRSLDEIVESIQNLVDQGNIHFAAARELHALHHNLTVLTDNPEYHDTTRAFFDALDGREAFHPDGTRVVLDFSIERARLNKTPINFKVEKLTEETPTFQQDIDQLIALETESFGASEARSRDTLIGYGKEPNCIYIARREGSQEILGYLFAREEKRRIYISGVARKAGAARMGVGESIFRDFLQARPNAKPVELDVRAGNKPAIALYQRQGFRILGANPGGGYNFPKERALMMRLA
jgi:ribosomal protein S18 acetylase RimI-like enzyme